MPTVILSPHLDDAVLSCWHVLTGPGEVSVVNVFAGVPGDRHAPAWWDAVTGAADSAARLRERLAEDRAALARAGRTSIDLSFLDAQYRDGPQPAAPVRAALERLLRPGTTVLAPAALGPHADHALVRAVALDLRRTGLEVVLYADLPHAMSNGWPAWVHGGPAGRGNDRPAVAWRRALAGTGARTPSVHRLPDAAFAAKLAAVGCYATQLPGLANFAGRRLTDRSALGDEVTWPTRAPLPAARPRATRR